MAQSCPHCTSTQSPDGSRPKIVRFGFFRRVSDRQEIQRFKCSSCKRSFSQATGHECFGQKKRHKNDPLKKLYVSGVSIRRAAWLLKINKGTVLRKLAFEGKRSRRANLKFVNELPYIVSKWQFDDQETFEHSPCKPLSIIFAVEAKTRLILGFEVSQMPANGPLVHKSKKKYGHREDHRRIGRRALFTRLQSIVSSDSEVTSDKNPHYPRDVKKFFPAATHKTVKGKRGAITGQGELKKVGFDPIFSFNHSCAMLRANINRLFRKTWCTTKKRENLSHHIELYVEFHNAWIVRQSAKKAAKAA